MRKVSHEAPKTAYPVAARNCMRDSSQQRDSSHPSDAGIDTGAEADVEAGSALDGEEVLNVEGEDGEEEDAAAEDDDDAAEVIPQPVRPLSAF